MSLRTKISLLIVSLGIPAYIYFNVRSLRELLILTVVLGIIIFGVVASVFSLKQRLGFLPAVALAIIAFIVLYFQMFFLRVLFIEWPAGYGDHFRTNLITKKCEVSLGDKLVAEPWYYKPGCNVSKQEKLDLLRKHPKLFLIQNFCYDPSDKVLHEPDVTCADVVQNSANL